MSTDLCVEICECSVVSDATLLHKFPQPDPSYLGRCSANCDNLLLVSTRTLPDSQRISKHLLHLDVFPTRFEVCVYFLSTAVLNFFSIQLFHLISRFHGCYSKSSEVWLSEIIVELLNIKCPDR
jgi:hypothetical protein